MCVVEAVLELIVAVVAGNAWGVATGTACRA